MTTIRFLLVTFLFSVTLPAVLAADSVESLRKKAKAGSLKAKVEIAHLSLRSQQGVEYDAEMIFKTFTQGAKANLSRAHYGLAKCYVLGVDTKPDQKLALKHAKASAKLNDPQGIRYLGNCYLYGRGMDKPDIEKGIGLLKKSIKMGNIMAEYTYAFYLTQNCKDEASNKKGLAMVNSLIKRKHPDSAHLLGMLYHDGRAGLENNREQAMKYYRMAAELNHADGFHQVGNMLLQDKKPKEAIGWLVKGVNRGSYNACWTLSKILKADPDLQEEPNQWVEYAEVAA
ncbi:MAG: tetratricopeptide repeat protein, partial [Akkermansiaceae bacterium]